MSINAVPERYTSAELGCARDAPCPLCRTCETDEGIDRLWVVCPLVGGRPICEGCCLDYQGLARSEVFDDDPVRGLFDDLSFRTGMSVSALRRKCLEHQQEIVSDQLGRVISADERDALLSLANRLSEAVLTVPD